MSGVIMHEKNRIAKDVEKRVRQQIHDVGHDIKLMKEDFYFNLILQVSVCLSLSLS